MVERRTAQRWRVLVDGVEQASVEPGESLEIGRRPLRPLPDDGHRRFEIDDSTRSMSKRHALVEVQSDGSASVTDLNSTNGSYRVDSAGLIGLTPRQPFALTAPAMHLQFGDVPVDFVCVDEPEGDPSRKIEVSDLFDYAAPGAAPEPDIGELSVDDILNLRAGEPTRVFNAEEVASRIHGPQAGSHENSGRPSRNGHNDDESVEGHAASMSRADESDNAEGVQDARSQTGAVDALSVNIAVTPAGESKAVQSRNLFEDAKTVDAPSQQPDGSLPVQKPVSGPSSVSLGQPDYDAAHLDALIPKRPTNSTQQTQGSAVQSTDQALPQQDQPVVQPEPVVQSEQVQQNPQAQPANQSQHQPLGQSQDQPQTIVRQQHQSEVQSQSQPVIQTQSFDQGEPQNGQQPQAQQTPVFEPGSIFEKVSNGDFESHGKVVEVDGLSSDDARKTEDFTVQFEMAKHEQLLPFLAMNTSLYDDLYAWLEAQGNQDIDTALSHNSGYKHYRDASGKGL